MMKVIQGKRKKVTVTFSSLLWISLGVVLNQGVNSQYVPFGFQSGKYLVRRTGDSYAGSLYYDNLRNLLFVTGATYAANEGNEAGSEYSSCMISTLKMPAQNNGTGANPDNWMFSQKLGTSDVNDVCSAIQVYNPSNTVEADEYKKPALFGIGHSEPGGLLSSIKAFSTTDSDVFGLSMFMELKFDVDDLDNVVSEARADLIGGTIFHDDKVEYPVAIAHNLEKSNVYVAMLSSSFNNLNEGYRTTEEQTNDKFHDHYDMTAGGGYENPKMGKDFSITIKRLTLKTEDEIANEPKSKDGTKQVFDVEWTREFEPNNDSQPRVADMLYVSTDFHGGFLIFAGTTSGYGEAFGSISAATSNTQAGVDIDGFITKIHSTTGNFPTDISQPFTKRIQSKVFSNDIPKPTSSGKVDEIKGLCQNLHPTGTKNTHFYAVGSTTGRFTTDSQPNLSGFKSPFIMKISIDTLETIWVRQIPTTGKSDVIAYSCSVTNDNDDVYIAGTVYDGGSIIDNYPQTAEGGSDIFVSRFNTADGFLYYSKQIGTTQNDTLAKGNGITCDVDGNAILLASTRGNFHRWRDPDNSDNTSSVPNDDASDFVVLTIKRDDGEYRLPNDSIFTSAIRPTSPDSVEEPTPSPNVKADSKAAEIFMIVILCAMVSMFLFVGAWRFYQYSEIEYDDGWDGKQDDVMRYLEDFDDSKVELHIRHSATGGIHGIYDFDRKGYEYDENRNDVTVNLTSAADHIDTDTDAILKDALFLDYDEKDSTTGNGKDRNNTHTLNNDDNNSELEEKRQSYLGLVDSYDQSWAERSPHSISTANGPLDPSSPPPSVFPMAHNQQHTEIDGDYDSGDDQIKESWGKEIV